MEKIRCGAIPGHQLLLFEPGRAGPFEHIDGAGVADRPVVMIAGADHCIVIIQSGGDAKPVLGRAIRRQQLGLLDPGRSIPFEYIGRPRTRAQIFIKESAHHCIVTVDRHRYTETVIRTAVIGRQLGLLHPIRAGPPENIGRTRLVGCVVVPAGADDGVIPADAHPVTEIVLRSPVRRHQLFKLDPFRAIPAVEIGRAGIISPRVVIEMRADNIPGSILVNKTAVGIPLRCFPCLELDLNVGAHPFVLLPVPVEVDGAGVEAVLVV